MSATKGTVTSFITSKLLKQELENTPCNKRQKTEFQSEREREGDDDIRKGIANINLHK